MTSVVCLDDPQTWPAQFRGLVEDAARTDDDPLPWDYEDGTAVTALQGCRIRAYHCTRLTPREVNDIRSGGLRPLSMEFTRERLANAVEDGHLISEEAAFYGQTRYPLECGRAGKTHLFTNRAALRDAGGVGWPLETWGGEGIYGRLHRQSPEMARLQRVGTPSVVIAAVDLAQHCAAARPGIIFAAARQLRSGDGGTNIVSESLIGPGHIETIEHPGEVFWGQYVWAPQGGFQFGT